MHDTQINVYNKHDDYPARSDRVMSYPVGIERRERRVKYAESDPCNRDCKYNVPQSG